MTSEAAGSYNITPIGRVVLSVGEGDEMPIDGVPASIEVFPEYEAGLAGIESNTHLLILGWFHKADRSKPDPFETRGPGEGRVRVEGAGQTEPDRAHLSPGVGGSRAGSLRLDRLDMIDGTPIVDIKRYSPGWNSIFSARTSRDTEHPGNRNRASFLRDMLVRGGQLSRGEVRGCGPRGPDGRPCDTPLGHR